MKQRVLGSLVLALILLTSVFCLIQANWGERLSTAVMDLVPDRSLAPEVSLSRGVLSDIYANRVVVALSSLEDERGLDAYVNTLEASPLVARVVQLSDPSSFADLGAFLFRHRFDYLFPIWLQQDRANASVAALGARVVDGLDSALDDPGFFAFEELVPSDPLLLMRDAASVLEASRSGRRLDESTHLLEVALAVSALRPEGQVPVFKLLDRAESAAREWSPEVRVLDTGAHRYAAETEAKMRAEVKTLNVSTVLIVFLICTFLCRRVFLIVHVFLILLISLLGGVALTLIFCDQIHVFALIFACVLCGIIVDYGLHAYLHRIDAARPGIRSFLKPFLISCGSTLMGFSILLFSDLPVLRQMGILVICGLATAVLVTLVYVFFILQPKPEVSAKATHRDPLASHRRVSCKLREKMFVALGLVICAASLWVDWEDDIRDLKYPLPHLEAIDAEIRALQGGEKTVLLTVGDSFASSRERLEKLSQWLGARVESKSDRLSARGLVPTENDFIEAREFRTRNPGFAQSVALRLEAGGYDPEAFSPFIEDWRRGAAFDSYDALIEAFQGSLGGAASGLVGAGDEFYWWVTLVDASVSLGSIPSEYHTMRLSQVESMSSVLAEYRTRTLELSLLGGLTMFIVLMGAFGWKDGWRLSLLPLVAVASAAVVIDSSFGPLGLFHLIGLFLGGCLVLDYAVFSWIGMRRSGKLPFSVLVSAVTTAASFAVLCWSRIPAIHSLGLAVFSVTLIGAILTYVLIPCFVFGKSSSDAPQATR